MKNKKYIIELIINIILALVIFVFTFLLSSIIFPTGFAPFSVANFKAKIKDTMFWIQTMSTAMAGLISFSMAYNARFAKSIDSGDFLKLYDEYDKLIDEKDLNQESFKKYMREKNIESKTILYKEKWNEKLVKYELKYDNIEPDYIRFKLRRIILTNKKEKYRRKIEKCKQKLDEDYIKENIPHLKVKHFKLVKLTYFKKNIFNHNTDNYKYVSKADSKYRMRLGINAIKKISTSLLFTLIVLSSGIEFKFNIKFWAVLLMCLFIFLTSLVSGIRFATSNFNKEIIDVLDDRIDYLESFKKWLEKNDDKYYNKVLNQAVNAEIERRIEEKQKEIEKE